MFIGLSVQGKACQRSHASRSSVRIHNYKDAFHSYSLFQPPHQDEIQYHKNFQWKGVHTGTVAVTVAVLIIVLQLKQGKKNPALPFQLRRQAFFITPPKIISSVLKYGLRQALQIFYQTWVSLMIPLGSRSAALIEA